MAQPNYVIRKPNFAPNKHFFFHPVRTYKYLFSSIVIPNYSNLAFWSCSQKISILYTYLALGIYIFYFCLKILCAYCINGFSQIIFLILSNQYIFFIHNHIIVKPHNYYRNVHFSISAVKYHYGRTFI